MFQRKYSLDRGVRPDKFLMEQNLKLTPTTRVVQNDPTKYRKLIGRIIYLTITRLGIFYSFKTLIQFMHEPRKLHWDDALRVLRYIKGTHRQGMLFSTSNDLSLKAFCDSNW